MINSIQTFQTFLLGMIKQINQMFGQSSNFHINQYYLKLHQVFINFLLKISVLLTHNKFVIKKNEIQPETLYVSHDKWSQHCDAATD